jgi:hypothetical protein
MRGSKIIEVNELDPLTLTLSRRERELDSGLVQGRKLAATLNSKNF